MFSVTSSAAAFFPFWAVLALDFLGISLGFRGCFFASTAGSILLYRFRGARSCRTAGATPNSDSSDVSAINCRSNKD
jgi:hypothetical protein